MAVLEQRFGNLRGAYFGEMKVISFQTIKHKQPEISLLLDPSLSR